MQILNSNYQKLCPVNLPWNNRQKYMMEIDLSDIKMENGFEDYLESIRSLCHSANITSGTAFVTIDEKIIKAGNSQRRPLPHVDGCFIKNNNYWGHSPHPQPSWNHYCNHISGNSINRMAVIVAASVSGCRAWKGVFNANPKSDGDLSHISDQLGEGEILAPNYGYYLSPDCIHESMIFNQDTQRSFLRIALPLNYR